jgi:hypothetical protein
MTVSEMISLKMESVSASETSVNFCETALHSMPEDSHLHIRHRENLKSHTLLLRSSLKSERPTSSPVINTEDWKCQYYGIYILVLIHSLQGKATVHVYELFSSSQVFKSTSLRSPWRRVGSQ